MKKALFLLYLISINSSLDAQFIRDIRDTIFVNTSYGSVSFFDADNDQDQDVLLSGQSENGIVSKLYKNDGLGNLKLIL